MLAATINQVRRGQLDPRIANAVGYLSATLLRALEIGNLEQRLRALEIATGNQVLVNPLSEAETFEFKTMTTHDQRETIDPN